MVLIIKKLVWDKKNTKHIARHHVTVSEVYEVIGKYFYTNGTKGKRKLITGVTDDGRILEIPMAGKGAGKYYPITAYDAGSKQAQKYLSAKAKKVKGGELN